MTEPSASTTSRPRLAIGGAEVGRCLTRLHHDRFTPSEPVDDPVRDRLRRRGLEFEREVISRLAQGRDHVSDLRHVPIAERAAATAAAVATGASLIFGGRLEGAGGTTVGMPDVLVHDGGGYLPVDVKHHKVIGEAGDIAIPAPLEHIGIRDASPVSFRSRRRSDLLQVAHYWVLLAERGWATGTPWGGVIGTDDPPVCLWVDLSEGDPSPLEARKGFLEAALAAVEHGAIHPDDPLVPASRQSACSTCPWYSLCIPQLERIGDPTLLRGITGERREELRDAGARTIADIAALEPDGGLVSPETVFQARAMSFGGLLRVGDGPVPPLPRHPIEVDLDIETYGPLTYLAGLALTDATGTSYRPIARWSGDADGEREVLELLFEALDDLGRRGAVVYHWTGYEVDRLSAGARRHGLAMPSGRSVEEWFDDHAVDLCAWSREHLVSPAGHSLKTIAPLCGFSWRDDDPGGLQSELWFEAQLAGDPTSRDRIVRYNEDDVLAQVAVRSFVRAAAGDGARSGGEGGPWLPSVHTWPVEAR